VLLCALAVHPQTAPAVAPDGAVVAEVIVTGSHIPRPAFASVSPLVTVDSRDIEDQGAMRVEDVIDRLPQATPDQTSAVTNGATGTASVNLRDLGPERTLVLIDGKRLAPGDPTSGEIAPDLNFIPDALVERIDIVTGGASAVYGSDAIAGVVNFIMKKDFTGLKLDVQTGFFNHANDDAEVQSLLIARHDPVPPSVVDDGLGAEATLAWGANSPDGKGNLTLYGGYRRTDAVPESTRDFSACPLEPLGAGDIRGCSGSISSPNFSRFIVFDPAIERVVGNLSLDPNGPGDTLRPFRAGPDAFNYAPYQYFQRPTTGTWRAVSPTISFCPHSSSTRAACSCTTGRSPSSVPAACSWRRPRSPAPIRCFRWSR
jgi:iron complex outermembrane receptor protein